MPLPYAVATAAFALIVLLSILGGHFVPPSAKLPMHWNLRGQPGMFAPRWVALSFLPILSGASFLLIAFLSAGTPQGGKILFVVAPIFVVNQIIYLLMMKNTPPGEK
jgi:hypothetical protein